MKVMGVTINFEKSSGVLSSVNDGHTLRFLTAGSVDDGKSTLIGRLLLDSRAILADQLTGIQQKATSDDSYDLARLTDGLQAEREQGITIDVAYRYFTTPNRKFIIADAPGHEQYTRNMVTAASNSDAAVILVDATKLHWDKQPVELLSQTRRHALLAHLLRVPFLIFAINKLDAVSDPDTAFINVSKALQEFALQAGLQIAHIIPISALTGANVIDNKTQDGRASLCADIYHGPTLLQALTELPACLDDVDGHFYFPVQYVQKQAQQHTPEANQYGQRIFWGKVASGTVKKGDLVTIQPSGQQARISKILHNALGEELPQATSGKSIGIVLDKEIDISRGDWLTHGVTEPLHKEIKANLAWLDDEPLVIGRAYWLKHGHRWVKAKISAIHHQLNIKTLETEPAHQLQANSIGEVRLQLQQALPLVSYNQSRTLGAFILVDSASNHTSGAGMVL